LSGTVDYHSARRYAEIDAPKFHLLAKCALASSHHCPATLMSVLHMRAWHRRSLYKGIVDRNVTPCKSSKPASKSIHFSVVRGVLKQMTSVALVGDDVVLDVVIAFRG
jgi:hypothetical protein